jgi:serine protease Do
MDVGSGVIGRLKGNRVLSTLLVLVTLTVGILIGTVISRGVKGSTNLAGDATPVQMATPQQLSSAFATIAKQIEPSVVNINTESTIKPQRRGRRAPNNPDDQGDDNFQDFFDRFFGGPGGGEQGPFGSPEGTRQRSLGSGVILDAKGYIVTNAHVVDKADRVRVNLMDDAPGVQYDAKVIGVDRETDLAVIKIEPKKALPAAKLGNSDSLNVGDWVLAIGSPFGLEQTVTAGIISSKGRNIDNARQFQSFLQTDAAINPGNSGGPLVNMSGEVIGINTAIFTQSYGSQGVGFALPSKVVADVYNQLIGPGNKVTRGSIGVVFNAQPNPAIQRVYGANSGVTIASVTPGGPSEQAGLKTGDTIIAVDGKKITDGNELVGEISARKPGTKANLAFLRDGKEQKTTVTIADRAKLFPSDEDEAETADSGRPEESKLGVSVRALTPEFASRLGIPPNKGVVVQDVKSGSFGDDIGLQRGVVILEINKQPINSEEDFRRIQSQLKSGQDVALLVRAGTGRNGGTVFLGGTLP